MKIACLSDIHGMWGPRPTKNCPGRWTVEVQYPPADVLVLAGDILGNYQTCRGDYLETAAQLMELKRLDAFFGELKAKGIYQHVILVSGNHDWLFEKEPHAHIDVLNNVKYLKDEAITLTDKDGRKLKFYGSPWTPWFHAWAFSFPRGTKYGGDGAHAAEVARMCWDRIPDDTNVLITHSPPWGTLDSTFQGEMVGCPELEARVEKLSQLKLHIFGHIHWSRGTAVKNGVTFVNAAACNEEYHPENLVQVVEI